MDNIYMELEKLICYCMDKDVVEASDVEAVCTNRITNHIFDMINEGNAVKAVFQGHYHPGFSSEHNGVKYFTIPAMCENENTFFIYDTDIQGFCRD